MPQTHSHDTALKNPDGSWKFTNALADESSPYLLQHAHNPVQWHAWGPQAFETARQTGKPIFLSVGYSTCYWCHVMEREDFEDPGIADLMNRLFINIKVDREERPDVDDIYMAVVQMMTRHGGWPMSVFLTPPGAGGGDDKGLKPIHAGTYFPPQPRQGMPGFPQILEAVSDAWQNRRTQVLEQADQIVAAVSQHLGARDEPSQPDLELVQSAANQLLSMYDPGDGGFGGAPKFPQPSNLQFLLGVHRNNEHDELWKALSYTLERMARGGMNDQIGGGFHRYSTDGKWLVPHFEKMLYDNGQLVEAYLVAQQIKPDPRDPDLYARVARDVCDYVLREMVDESGAFHSAQDAEVDAREGGNYVWTPQQVRAAVDDEGLADLALKMYGLDQGTNFQDPHYPHEPPTNVLFLPERLEGLALDPQRPLDALLAQKRQIDRLLMAERATRRQPSTDDKVLVAWNGLMIGGLAMAGRVLGEHAYTAAAQTAATTILDRMATPDGGLHRSMRNGDAKIAAFLEDYAFLIHGLLELHRATQHQRWLDAAVGLDSVVLEKFSAQDEYSGGYFDTLDGQQDLFVRVRSTYDGAIPSGNSQIVHNVLDLYELTGDEAFFDRAWTDLSSFVAAMRRQGPAMVHMHHALLRAVLAKPQRAAASPHAGAPSAADTRLAVEVEPKILDLSGGSANLRITLRIAEGHHINANEPGTENLIATQLSLEGGAGLSIDVNYPPGASKKYPFADRPLNVYEGTVAIEAVVRAREGSSTPSVSPRLVLRYQMCSDNACFASQTTELPVSVQ